jgi:hypothetical protein
MPGRRPRGILAVSIAVLAMVALGGSARAVWSASGGGTGSGSTATVTAVTLGPGTPVAGLYPGGRADVVLTISNPDAADVHVGSLSLDTVEGDGGYAVDAGHAGCAVSTFGFSTSTNGGAGWAVPARSGNTPGSLAVTLTGALSMDVDAANACQGATATVYLTAGP